MKGTTFIHIRTRQSRGKEKEKKARSPIDGHPDSGRVIKDFARTIIVGVEKPNTHHTIVGGDGINWVTTEVNQSTVAEPSTACEFP